METTSLLAATEEFMAGHPRHSWTVLTDDSSDFAVEITLRPDPDRVATVRVGGWVVEVSFHGHEETEFVDADGEVVEAMKDALARAVRLTQGPTSLVVFRDGDKTLGSRVDLGEDAGAYIGSLDISWPFRRLATWLHRRPITEQHVDLEKFAGG